MTSLFDLTGKKVFITGGSGFLANHFTKALTEAGASVCVADIADYKGSEPFVRMDVTDQQSVDTGLQEAIEKLGGLDVVINNAAIDPKFDPNAAKNDRLFENYPEEAMRQSVEVNMLGYWRVSKAAVKHFLQNGRPSTSSGQVGNLINISSIYGVSVPHQDIYPEGTQKPVDYGMTKAAIQYLTRYIAGTYGKQGIRSNALVLGGVFKGHDDEFVKKYGQYSMFGRMTLPEEVGAPLVFLASDASQGMTGHLLAVDGGFSAW